MNVKQDLTVIGEGMVYFRDVAVADLPEDVQAQAEGFDIICAVHNHAGEQIALVANPRLAAHLAREHQMQPVALH